MRESLGLCTSLKLSFKIIPASYASLAEKVSAAMLRDRRPAWEAGIRWELHLLMDGARLDWSLEPLHF